MSKQPKVLLAHPGIQHAPKLAEALEREGLLARFWTGWAHTGGAGGKRSVAIPDEKLRTRPWVEWMALVMNRAGLPGERVWHARNAIFQKMIPDSEIRSVDVVVGFDTASWILAERAKACGKRFILEQSIGHPGSRADELEKIGCSREVWPEAFEPRLGMVASAERKEHELADWIVVASSFARRTLVEQGVPEAKVKVLPYGVGEEFLTQGRKRKERAPGSPLRFLFLGHLSARKGLRQLLEAWSGLGHGKGELVLMGGGEQGEWKQLAGEGVIFRGPGSRGEVLAEMARCDVLVFPSLFEGFGLVILEAMAAGLPVLASRNTGGPDVIEEEKEGFIVPAGSVEALREKMGWLIQNPSQAVEMGRKAHARASQYSWETYGQRYREEILG
jgi:starch synthase